MKSIAKAAIAIGVVAAGAFTLTSISAPARTSNGTKADADGAVSVDDLPAGQATAVFAMGCFWCAEADYEKIDGVVDVISGYTGGKTTKPNYQNVTYGNTGHYEAVLVTYDTTKLDYDDLLSVFWKNVDPFDAAGQFCDKGSSYRAAIFPGTADETQAANSSKQKVATQFSRHIETKVIPRADFWAAEDYHQDYYKKNPIRYRYYRSGCGRDARLEQIWGD